jgi:hypothetical protein
MVRRERLEQPDLPAPQAQTVRMERMVPLEQLDPKVITATRAQRARQVQTELTEQRVKPGARATASGSHRGRMLLYPVIVQVARVKPTRSSITPAALFLDREPWCAMAPMESPERPEPLVSRDLLVRLA